MEHTHTWKVLAPGEDSEDDGAAPICEMGTIPQIDPRPWPWPGWTPGVGSPCGDRACWGAL